MSKCVKCGSYAFNLYKEGIDQGGLCDVHYWQYRAHRAEALAEQPARPYRLLQDNGSKYFGDSWDKAEQPAQDDPCPGCHKGAVCRTPECGRLKLPVDHPYRSEQPAQQEQEPICKLFGTLPVYDRAAQQQEPVARFIRWGEKGTSGEGYTVEFIGEKPLPPNGALFYTSPQPAQRKQVGDSRFERWYSEDFEPKGKGTKQQMREAYEAGMNDPPPSAQQEPVAWMWRCKPYCNWPEWGVSLQRPADSGCDGNKRTEGYEDIPLYNAPQPQRQPQQEPVAWATQLNEYAHIKWGAKRPEYPMVYEFPLYTSPPAQRTWVGLTDEDIAVVLTGDASLGTRLDELTPSWIELVKAVEAKLKEKNT